MPTVVGMATLYFPNGTNFTSEVQIQIQAVNRQDTATFVLDPVQVLDCSGSFSFSDLSITNDNITFAGQQSTPVFQLAIPISTSGTPQIMVSGYTNSGPPATISWTGHAAKTNLTPSTWQNLDGFVAAH